MVGAFCGTPFPGGCNGGERGFSFDGSVFTKIDVPGTVNTAARAINNNGTIAAVANYALFNSRGFVTADLGKTFTLFDYPGATFTDT